MSEEEFNIDEPDWMKGLPGTATCGTQDVLEIFGYSKSTSVHTVISNGGVPEPTGRQSRNAGKKPKLAWTIDSIRLHIHKRAKQSLTGSWKSTRVDIRGQLSKALSKLGPKTIAELAYMTGDSMRDTQIAVMVSEGQSYREVADWCDVSTERVYQICKRTLRRLTDIGDALCEK